MSSDCPMIQRNIAPLILAAGSAIRMGGRPKCLLAIDSQPLICRVAKTVTLAGLTTPVIVLGHHAAEVMNALKGYEVKTVINRDSGSDQVGSFRLGLGATDPRAEAVMVLLADQPLVGVSELLSLIDAYDVRPPETEFVQPFVAGLPGNPVIFTKKVRDEILSQPSVIGAKKWASDHPDAFYKWNTRNPHYRVDLDNQDDIEQLKRCYGLSVTWPEQRKHQRQDDC